MKKVCYLFCFFYLVSFSARSQYYEFNQPWRDSTKAIVIDPYGENEIDFEKLITDRRIVGIIHKASQGYSADKRYPARKVLSKKNNLLWGSYHMGMRGDPIKQADFYLMVTQNDSTELMALDLEGLDTTTFMSIKNAERFIQRIHYRTGRYPLLYCNDNILEEISKNYSD
ncbi:MAG: GH25 family lysozyme, partial [Bacteroidetes bacterium]|nr:GH25 family lysozyme [Bacteroidota bacterium]